MWFVGFAAKSHKRHFFRWFWWRMISAIIFSTLIHANVEWHYYLCRNTNKLHFFFDYCILVTEWVVYIYRIYYIQLYILSFVLHHIRQNLWYFVIKSYQNVAAINISFEKVCLQCFTYPILFQFFTVISINAIDIFFS